MGYPNSENLKKLLTLNEAAQELGVTIDALIEWNDLNILKPTISLSGEVGYTQEQVDKFGAIRKLTVDLSSTGKIESNFSQKNTDVLTQDRIVAQIKVENNINPLVGNADTKHGQAALSTQNSHKFSFVSFVFPLFAIAIPLAVIIIMQQGKQGSLINFLTTQEDVKTTLTSNANKANLGNSGPLPTQAKEKNFSEDGLRKTDKTALGNTLSINLKKNTATNAASAKTTENDLVNAKTASVAGISSVGYSEAGMFANSKNSPNSAFDTNGNIMGEVGKSDVLAMNFEAIREIVKDRSVKQNNSLNTVLIFFGLGIISFIFLFRKQNVSPAKAVVKLASAVEQKIVMNVNQKTDGTVVLCFQGKEYKICKPDMDSESDQFIERLMGFTASSIREFDYDTTVDSQVSFNAPLSKLVTRLGFVGIKRDLFFPRTSKNSVLFRRYITEHDLVSMNISSDQVLKEFSAIN
jgi:hypothetical protein